MWSMVSTATTSAPSATAAATAPIPPGPVPTTTTSAATCSTASTSPDAGWDGACQRLSSDVKLLTTAEDDRVAGEVLAAGVRVPGGGLRRVGAGPVGQQRVHHQGDRAEHRLVLVCPVTGGVGAAVHLPAPAGGGGAAPPR